MPVAGGSTVSSVAAKGYVNAASAEIHDPVANTWTATSARARQLGRRLRDVLVSDADPGWQERAPDPLGN